MQRQSGLMKIPIRELESRTLPDGGFAAKPGGNYRLDATAWAAIAIKFVNPESTLLSPALEMLAKDQQADGRISISTDNPEAFWPTPLTILAWQGFSEYRLQQTRAIDFLLKTTGYHFPRESDIFAHDSLIKGWPWSAETHSWVGPTVLAMVALRVTGNRDHPRVKEAARMLMDRQLPSGGWNYGNTRVFGAELRPMPDTTGMALQALAGLIDAESVQHSIDYLQKEISTLKTPISLGWALLGLAAWGKRPDDADESIGHCLKLQSRYGPYETCLLCLLIIAQAAQNGLLNS
jgi:hypothetical protein